MLKIIFDPHPNRFRLLIPLFDVLIPTLLRAVRHLVIILVYADNLRIRSFRQMFLKEPYKFVLLCQDVLSIK